MDSNFSYGDTRAPKAEASRASRVARAPERAMLAAGCTTVIAGALSHRGFVQFASAIVAIDPGRCRVSTLQQPDGSARPSTRHPTIRSPGFAIARSFLP